MFIDCFMSIMYYSILFFKGLWMNQLQKSFNKKTLQNVEINISCDFQLSSSCKKYS